MANDLEKQVLRLIGEDVDSPDAFADITPIRDSINDAVQEIAVMTGGIRDTWHVPLRESNFYRLNGVNRSIAWVHDAWLVSQNRRLAQTSIIRLSHMNPRWLVDTGSPDSYFQVGHDIVGVYRRPTGTTDVLQLNAVIVPGRYETDDERVHVRRQYERAVIHYAVSEYYASRGDAQEAALHWNDYLSVLGLAVNHPEAAEKIRRFGGR